MAPATTSKESPLQHELAAARARMGKVNKQAKIESKAVRNAAKKIDRIQQKARALSTRDLMEVYAMRTQVDERKEGKYRRC